MKKKTKAKRRAAKKSHTIKVTTRPRLKELTELQKRFVDILVSMKHPVKLEAFQLAGSKSTGKVASVEAQKTLNKQHVRAYYESLRQGATERAKKSADDIIEELTKVAFSNIKQYLNIEDDEVYFKDFADITDEQAAAIESVKVMKKIIKGKKEGDDDFEIQMIQFKLHSKLNALEQLGKHFGIFDKDNAQRMKPFILVFNHKDKSKEAICNQS